MRHLILLSFLFLFSCSKNENTNSQGKSVKEETAVKKMVKEETIIKKVVKEELLVEKLSDREKLDILLAHNETTPLAKTFQDVTDFLDPYGSTFAYANFEDTKTKYINSYKRFMDFLGNEMSQDISKMENISTFINIVTSMGFWEPDAMGLSHYRINDVTVRNKFCIHKKQVESPGYYWDCYGEAGQFNALNLLPEKTLLSAGFKVNKKAIIQMNSFLTTQLKKLKASDDTIKKLMATNKLFETVDTYFQDEIGFAIYRGTGNIVVKDTNIPSFAGCAYLKIRDNIQLELLQKAFPTSSVASFFKEFKGEPAFLIKDGYLFIFFDKASMKIFKSSDKSLAQSEHYQSIQNQLPELINSYSYLNPEVTDKTYDLILEEVNKLYPAEDLIHTLFPKEELVYHFFNVMEMKGNGIYMSGISNGNSTAFILVQSLMFTLHTLLFFPDIDYKKLTKKSMAAGNSFDIKDIIGLMDKVNISDLKPNKKKTILSLADTKKDLEFIRYALSQYAKSNNGYFPNADGAQGLEILVKKKLIKKPSFLISDMDKERSVTKDSTISEDETSYTYLGDKIIGTVSGHYLPIVFCKPKVLGDGFMVLLANNEIKYFKTGGASFKSILSTMNKVYKYNDRQKDILRKKFLDLR
ncbi:MAG: hypothetical protein NE334_01610 [Lentisphaeraceae bacterium]|nr:hypothetical protein [Lentisphaeraceae bacterium]